MARKRYSEESRRQAVDLYEARVADLEVNERKLVTERKILQRAAKYVAGETRW